MCGIAGALLFRGARERLTADRLTVMRETMTHRGPDGAGTWVADDGRVGLAHRRLAIIDLSEAAAQPMRSADGALWITYNGEVYNHAEVRAELEAEGAVFRTDHSDTEVVLQAFARWGIDCLERLQGMFAFGLWDARRRELWLVRDRIGVKPLYYARRGDRLTFASEIKALLADPGQERAVDEESLYHYLSFMTAPAPRTLFRGINKLPGGTWLRVGEDGVVRTGRYWDVWKRTRPLLGLGDRELAARVQDTLRRAVALRKVSDVPVGVFLSGGVDSSANTALFAEGEGAPVKTFTVAYSEEHRTTTNELAFARRMAAYAGTEHHERMLDQDDLLELLPRMIRLQDEPIADPVCMPVFYVAELARRHGVTVCQVGEGADELFWGYPDWKRKLRLARLDHLPVPRALKRLGLLALALSGRRETRRYEHLRRGSEGLPVFWGGAEVFTEAEKARLLSPRLRRRLRGLSSWDVLRPLRERFLAEAWEPSDLHWMTHVDLHMRLPELLLMRVDKMCMGVSLEARVPFLDHTLVELALSIPSAAKTRGGKLKTLLKRAVADLVPADLLAREKVGFGVPVVEWHDGRLGRLAAERLDAFTRGTDLLAPAAVRALLETPGRGYEAWVLLNLALWWEEFIA